MFLTQRPWGSSNRKGIAMSERIVLRTGEALFEAAPDGQL
jgi:hypothetical protein